jgi:hypothetical protein
VCVTKESKNLEEMTIEDLAGSFISAHTWTKKEKTKQKMLDEVLQAKVTIKEKKFMHL